MITDRSASNAAEGEGSHRPSALKQPRSGVARIACSAACELGNISGTIWNLSVLGAYIVVSEPLPEIGTEVRISFALEGDPVPIVTRARVAWHNPPSLFRGCGAVCPSQPPGCGVQFLALSPLDRERIEARVRVTIGR